MDPAGLVVRGRLVEIARGSLAGAALLAPAAAILGPTRDLLPDLTARLILALVCGCTGGLLMPLRRIPPLARVCLGVLLVTAVVALGQPLQMSVDYPFSLTWSEGNHLWASSLYFKRAQYDVVGDWGIPPYATSGLYVLEGLPFLIPGVGIAWLRLWTEGLLVLPPLGLAILAFSGRDLRLTFAFRACLVLWGCLFLLQPRSYAPLVLSAMLVVAAGARGSFRPLAWATGISTFYLGLSRWFWMAGPPAWAVTILLFREPGLDPGGLSGRFLRRALAAIAAAGLGFLAAVAWAALVEHRSLFLYLTTLRHPLLGYRLLPNATSPYGILPWVLVAVAPLAMIFVWIAATARRRDFLLKLGLVGVFLVGFLAMGLVASVKIGGGDNLHNLDLLFVHLLLVASLTVRSPAGDILARPRDWPMVVYPLIAAAGFLPILHVLNAVKPIDLPNACVAEQSLQVVAAEATRAAGHAPVLFIAQRQLLAFGLVPSVPLVMDHELVDLMDRAMANDQEYLQQFYAELEAGRYSLIISDPLPVVWRGRAYAFGEENDAWVERVTLPVLQWYEPVQRLDEVGVWLLRPRQTAAVGGAP